MTETARPIPENRAGAIPYLSIRSAGEALEFYKEAFGAHELFRIAHDGRSATPRSRSAPRWSC